MIYRREIDGLRAVAVVPVILFHAGNTIFSGGYSGVDIFFVISGYLITSILIADLERKDFSIVRFYERRARRILPALFVVIFACLPFAYLWMLPSQLQSFGESIVATVLFSSNMLFSGQEGYFAESVDLKPLLHTWSLAVEEQYYLFFPLVLMMCWGWGRNRVVWLVAVLAILSLALAGWGARVDPAATFYLAPARAWELLAGSLCAFWAAGRAPRSSNILSALGLALVVYALLDFDEGEAFPSAHTLIPVLGTSLIILFAQEQTWVARLLSTRPFVAIGLVSYSAYLWHQPLFAFARLRSMTRPSDDTMLFLTLCTFILAWVTWYFVEKPFRKGSGTYLGSRRKLFTVSGAVGGVLIAVGAGVILDDGFGWRTNGNYTFDELDEKVSINVGLGFDCVNGFNTSQKCLIGSPDVLLWGDSYAMHLVQGITASDPGLEFVQQTVSHCAPILGIAQAEGWTSGQSPEFCISFNDAVLDFLKSNASIKLVILSSPFYILRQDIVTSSGKKVLGGDEAFVSGELLKTVAEIRSTGARVVIVSPTPVSGWDIGQCLIRSEFLHGDQASCDFNLHTEGSAEDLLLEVVDTVPVYWLKDDICASGVCHARQDNVFIYRDLSHLSKEGSQYLGRKNQWMARFRSMAY